MSKVNKISINNIAGQHKYSIQNIFVYTPYQIYQAQRTFITYIIKCLKQKQNALIQSPTGTGKTMSLLCSTISWALDHQQITNQPPPQIIYASRTHSQLKQVVSEINKLCYQLKISILSSRDHSCINDDLKLLKGADRELQCRIRIAQKKGLSCKYYKNEVYYQKQAQLGKLMDLEEVTLKGKVQGFCPFYFERFSRAISNIVLIPYNYLFDQKVWTEQNLRLQGSILILDQAHNIQSVCQQFRQYNISLSILARATQQAEQLRVMKLNENKNKLDPGQLDKIKMLKVNLQDIQISAAYIQMIYEHMQTLDIPANSYGVTYNAYQFNNILNKATSTYEQGGLSRNIKTLISSFDNIRADLMFIPFWALQSWMKFIQKLSQLLLENQGKEGEISKYAVQVTYEGADIKISIYCLDPSSGFQQVIKQHKPRSIILTSGTLSPLKVWPLQLGVQFAQPVSCPHVLSPWQVNTVVLGVGASGQKLDTKFQSRKEMRLYEDIGQALYQIVKHTPNGVVALFPSYSFLQQVKNHLTTLKVLTKLYQCKNIHFERKDTADFNNTLERYMKQAQTEKGALLFALVRGRISEGLDFAHKKCRAIVLVGVPYPCSKDVKVIAKMNYLDAVTKQGKSTITGSQWYLAQTIRAVNQGIGRLIRTPDDFGTVYLLDSRFLKADIEAQIASWAKMSLFKPATFQQFKKKIKQINKVKQINPILAQQPVLVSTKGLVLGAETFQFPKTVKGSISGTFKPMDRPSQPKTSPSNLQQLISTMKTQKQHNDIKEEIKKKEEVDAQQLMEKQIQAREQYQKKIFAKKKRIMEESKQICPVCQMPAQMVKSNTCLHSLCQECWDKWLNQDLRCPICRGRVRKNFLVSGE